MCRSTGPTRTQRAGPRRDVSLLQLLQQEVQA